MASDNPEIWARWFNELESEDKDNVSGGSDVLFDGNVTVHFGGMNENEIVIVNTGDQPVASIDDFTTNTDHEPTSGNLNIASMEIESIPDDRNVADNITPDRNLNNDRIQTSPIEIETISDNEDMITPTVSNNDDVDFIVINSGDESSCREINETPEKKRFRIARPETWKRNIRKERRAAGLSYTTAKGEIRPAKELVPIEKCNCIYQCTNFIDVKQQEVIFGNFVMYADSVRQKDYICAMVKESPVQRKRKRDNDSGINKNVSRQCYLTDYDGEKVRVCQKFFCNSLGIKKSTLVAAMERKSPQNSYKGADRRKGRIPVNATSDRDVNRVVKFLMDFPKVPSHYGRAKSKRLYFAPDLNITKLYDMYKDKFGEQSVTLYVFRKIFHEQDPPLSVFVPKKDQCVTCNVAERDAKKQTNDYKEHIQRKTSISAMKTRDKEEAETNKNLRYATFDLQAVLLLPFAGDSQIYYKRKLIMHNLTVFDNTKQGFCFTWDETEGKKGSAEIGTCLIKYINGLPDNVERVTFYCDTCGGQNRNKNVMTALLYLVNKSTSNLSIIDLKFLESGHSYMETDSMHTTIERARKGQCLYVPSEYRVLMRTCRKIPFPYQVIELRHNDFYDLELLTKETVTNRNKNTSKETVNWLKIKWFRFEKGSSNVAYKYDVDGPFQYIETSKCGDWSSVSLKQKYKKTFDISVAKKRDLLSLIRTGVIPSQHTQFYRTLNASKEAADEPAWQTDYNPDDV